MSKVIELLLQLLMVFRVVYKHYKQKRSEDFKRDVHADPVRVLCKQLNPNSDSNSTTTNTTEHTTTDK